MSRSGVVKKSLKYLLYLLLSVALVLLLLLAYVLHTESGSRLAIKQVIGLTDIDLSYDSINGNLSDGLAIKNLRYQDQAVDIKVNNISYQSDWSWFNLHLELDDFNLDGVSITTKTVAENKPQSPAFSGIKLPITTDLKILRVNQLTFKSGSDSAADVNTLEYIELSSLIEAQAAVINRLLVEAPAFGVSATGSLDYSTGLSYLLELDWQAQSEGQSVRAKGPIQGNLSAVNVQQVVNLTSEQLTGQFTLQGEVKEMLKTPDFDFQLSASKTRLTVNQQTFQLNGLQADFKGLIEDYSLSLQSELSQQQLGQINLPSSQFEIKATGNSQQLTTQLAQITTPEGTIDLQAKLDWQDQFKISSLLLFSDLNPQQLLQDWPGLINGQIALNLTVTEQGVVINTQNNELEGQLKSQPFMLSGAASYTADTLSADQLQLTLGKNKVLINGQLNPQTTALEASIDWTDLSLIDPDLAGQFVGTVNVSGNHLNPQVTADLLGEKLTYAENQIAVIRINSQVLWNQDIATQINLEGANLAGQLFDSIVINMNGWLDDHAIDVALDNSELSSYLKLKGQFTGNKTAKNRPHWQGQITEHELTVDKDKKIQLLAPIGVEVTELIRIEVACWRGVEAGTLCVELNDIKQTDSSYQGSMSLAAFSLIPLQVLLPENIEIKGNLNGTAEFLYQNESLTVDSFLNLEAGELLFSNDQKVIYQTAIDVFEVDAKTNNQLIDVVINTQLADQSHLKLDANLINPNNQGWQINASLDGLFTNTQFIKELTEEINELEGQFIIQGSVEGPLLNPVINVELYQDEGYLILTRLGTVLEQLTLSINTEGVREPVYRIKFSGRNLAAINPGQIESTGKLSFPAADQWQYLGQINGDNFMVLNLPEVKFNVTPELSIKANQKGTDIKGNLSIDSGHVIVKQLPPSSISNSDDLEIHTSESINTVVYPFTMDLKARIKEPIKLDVVGLQAGLIGSIQLVKAQGKTLEGKGVLNLTDGSYEIYGQKLDINQGQLTFTGPLDNPRLNVKASRTSVSGDVVAGVQLGGTVNNLQSNLYSEPSLSDIEKLSYIMSGRGIDNSGNLDGESLKQAAIVMGLNQSSPIFNQIQSQFGIDVLTLRESAVAADTVVEAGKKINDKLYVSYNQGLFNRLGFWMLKYRINEFLNLQTTQGEDQSIEIVYTRKAQLTEPVNKENNEDKKQN